MIGVHGRTAARAAVYSALAALLLPGCMMRHKAAAPAPAPVPAVAQAAAPLQPLSPMARLYYDNGPGIQDSVRLVVRDAAGLATVWQQATSGQAAPPPVPAVDFSREMVLVAGGGRMTPADQIQVDSVGVGRQTTPEGRTENVFTAWLSITQGCQRFSSDAFPVEIVRVRRFDGPVRFVSQRVKAAGCQ